MVASRSEASAAESEDDDLVGRRLSIVVTKNRTCPATVVAYFPKTKKHRIRLDADQQERNVRLTDLDVHWQDNDINSGQVLKTHLLSRWQVVIHQEVVGRRMQVFHPVRQKWYQGTVLKYVEHSQKHTIRLTGQGKVHLVDLTQCPWRYTDLMGGPSQEEEDDRNPQDLATSKYMGVVRYTLDTWKAHYNKYKYLGCFASEKDAALAYDVYARKHNTLVNFGDRRICRAELKRLRVPEPPQVMEHVPSSMMSSPAPLVSSSAAVAPRLAAAAQAPVVVQSCPAASTQQPRKTGGSATSGAAPQDCTTLPLPPKDSSDCDHQPTNHPNNNNNKEEETSNRQLPAPKQQQAGRVTPSSVTEETEHEDSRDIPSKPEDDDDDEDHSPNDDDKPQGSSSGRAAAIHKNIFEDSEDEECEFQDTDDDENEDSSSSTVDNHHHHPTRHVNTMAHIFDSDSDEESDPPPKKKSQKNNKHKKESSDSSISRRRLRVIEETLSSDEDQDLDSSEYRPPPSHKKLSKKKVPSQSQCHSPPMKRNPGASPSRPKYTVGTRFVKEFPDYGTFEGEITYYDGRHYHVYYPADEDEEELSEYEFDEYEILPSEEACVKNPTASRTFKKRKEESHNQRRKKRRAIMDGCG